MFVGRQAITLRTVRFGLPLFPLSLLYTGLIREWSEGSRSRTLPWNCAKNLKGAGTVARDMTPEHKKVLQEFEGFAAKAATAKALMEFIAKRLHEKKTHYNWVGFYLVDPADAAYLLVGPFVGSFTPHARIPLNTGLCGAAASTGQVIVIQDVTKDPRYLAGSALVKSEIVVPIFVKKKLAAELDIESYFANTFVKAEQDFVEACAGVVATYLGKSV